MPREPFSEEHELIGQRLRTAREQLRIPRTKFALAVGITSDMLVNYEGGVVRLPWLIAWEIFIKFPQINPFWVGEGKEPALVSNNIFREMLHEANPEGYGIIRRVPFEEVYREYESLWKKVYDSFHRFEDAHGEMSLFSQLSSDLLGGMHAGEFLEQMKEDTLSELETWRLRLTLLMLMRIKFSRYSKNKLINEILEHKKYHLKCLEDARATRTN